MAIITTPIIIAANPIYKADFAFAYDEIKEKEREFRKTLDLLPLPMVLIIEDKITYITYRFQISDILLQDAMQPFPLPAAGVSRVVFMEGFREATDVHQALKSFLLTHSVREFVKGIGVQSPIMVPSQHGIAATPVHIKTSRAGDENGVPVFLHIVNSLEPIFPAGKFMQLIKDK